MYPPAKRLPPFCLVVCLCLAHVRLALDAAAKVMMQGASCEVPLARQGASRDVPNAFANDTIHKPSAATSIPCQPHLRSPISGCCQGPSKPQSSAVVIEILVRGPIAPASPTPGRVCSSCTAQCPPAAHHSPPRSHHPAVLAPNTARAG